MERLSEERNDFCGQMVNHSVKEEKGRKDKDILVNPYLFSFMEDCFLNIFPHPILSLF